MPRVRTQRTGKPPAGFELLEEKLDEFNTKMVEAEREPHEGKRKCESIWPILRINHQRSRYVFDMYYNKQEISKEVLDFCCREKYADAALIAKWKKQGYENLCCLACIQAGSSNFQTTCICRVPKGQLCDSKPIECVHCGCRGCASGD